MRKNISDCVNSIRRYKDVQYIETLSTHWRLKPIQRCVDQRIFN